jgi:hypothetical protein
MSGLQLLGGAVVLASITAVRLYLTLGAFDAR